MKNYSLIILIVILCFSCEKSFDIKSYDTTTIENYNSMVENIAVLGDMISYDALSDSATLSQFTQQGDELKKKIESSILVLKEAELPSDLDEYQESLLTVYQLYLDQIKHDLLFTSLDVNDAGFAIDSFAHVHDKMNESILKSTDSFNQVRDNILNNVYTQDNE